VFFLCVSLLGVAISVAATEVVTYQALSELVSTDSVQGILNNSEQSTWNAIQFFVRHKDDLIYSDISDSSLAAIAFGQPVPVLASAEKYQVGDSFFSKLELRGFLRIGYIDNAPICAIFHDIQDDSDTVAGYLNENTAITLNEAIESLNGPVISLPAEGIYYFVDSDNAVSVADPFESGYPITDLTSFAQAFEEAVAYYAAEYAENGEVSDGGGILNQLLFESGSRETVTSKHISSGWSGIMTTVTVGAAAGIICVTVFVSRRGHKKSG
jgi:hypothetical protein